MNNHKLVEVYKELTINNSDIYNFVIAFEYFDTKFVDHHLKTHLLKAAT